MSPVAARSTILPKKSRELPDGVGLPLFVSPSGGWLWRIRHSSDSKEKVLAFGANPDVKLADAPTLRDKAKRSLAKGRDHRASARAALTVPAGDTFEAVAREWIKAQEATWSPAHSARIPSRFERDVFRAIGSTAVAEVTAQQSLAMLRAVKDRTPDLARRISLATGAIMRYAIATGRASRDAAAELRGALRPTPRVKHMAGIEAGELSGFLWKKLTRCDSEPQKRHAIEFVIRTFVRSNEPRCGKWSQIDGDQWRIPGTRMKIGRDHIVSRTRQSLVILAKLKTIAGDSGWILPGGRSRQPISENNMLFGMCGSAAQSV